MGRDGSAACVKASQPEQAKRGRTMRFTTNRPFDGQTVPRTVCRSASPYASSSLGTVLGPMADKSRRPRRDAAARRRTWRSRRRRWSARPPSGECGRGSPGAWACPSALRREAAASPSSWRSMSRSPPAPAGPARWSPRTRRTDGCGDPPADAAASPLSCIAARYPAGQWISIACDFASASRSAVKRRRSSGSSITRQAIAQQSAERAAGTGRCRACQSIAKPGPDRSPGYTRLAGSSRIERLPVALRSPPVDPLQQHRQLRSRQGDLALLRRRPDEPARLEAPGELPLTRHWSGRQWRPRALAVPPAARQGIAQQCPGRGTILIRSPRCPR